MALSLGVSAGWVGAKGGKQLSHAFLQPSDALVFPASLPQVDPETKNLRDGDYVGVRRFVRILEQGSDAKATVDKASARTRQAPCC